MYPGKNLATLHPTLRPFVLLEVGSARVTPAVRRDMTSFVHQHLEKIGELASFADNRPRAVRCVHPLVTLLEKLDALHRRVPRQSAEPATFVRHFEDAARIIDAAATLPPLTTHTSPRELAKDLLVEKQVAQIPDARDAAFAPDGSERWTAIRDAHGAIAPTFWGERTPIEACCTRIRDWIARELMTTVKR